MDILSSLPPSFWAMLAMCAMSVVLLWWMCLGARRSARRRRLEARIERVRAASLLPDAPSAAPLRATLSKALANMARDAGARGHRRRTAHYATPWLLFIGDAPAQESSLLGSLLRDGNAPTNGIVAPTTAPLGPDFWRWWLMPWMTAIEVHPALVGERATLHEDALWFQALLALAEKRARLPLDGIVACVGVESLRGDAAGMELYAMRLQRRMDEVVECFALHLPMTIVVTGLEALPGYSTVCDALPAYALQQALGYRFPVDSTGAEAGAHPALASIASIASSCHALRMTLLRDAPDAARRRDIHRFMGHLQSLQPALGLLGQRLLGPPNIAASRRWRGLYFTGSGTANTAPAFVLDVFRRFLPRDS